LPGTRETPNDNWESPAINVEGLNYRTGYRPKVVLRIKLKEKVASDSPSLCERRYQQKKALKKSVRKRHFTNLQIWKKGEKPWKEGSRP